MVKKVLETSNNYSDPYRPLPIAIFNACGKTLKPFGFFGDLEVERLMQAAQNKTGLNEYGELWFVKPLSHLVKAINKDAKLTPFGLIVQRMRLVDALSARLRVEDLLSKHPEILSQDLGKLVVIAGLQRTGTTTLHRLMAADPNMRSLASWEALNPLPLPGEKNGKPSARIKAAKTAEKGLAYLAPEFFAIHPVEHDAPEEDILLLDLCFMSQAPEATFYVPEYAQWLEEQDHTPAYEYLKTLLKILHWQSPKKNWVLKTPHHMEYLDILLKVFPEATVVQTHRDPQKTTGSFCSMVAHGRGVFSDDVDAKEVARHWVKKVRRMMSLSIEVRKKLGDDNFIDISYYDLIDDPIEQLKSIYQKAGIPFDEKSINAATNTSKKNVQNRYGKHIYHLEDFDLSKEKIESEYGFYREAYAIPNE